MIIFCEMKQTRQKEIHLDWKFKHLPFDYVCAMVFVNRCRIAPRGVSRAAELPPLLLS